MLNLILKENSFKFNGKDYLQTDGTTMGTNMAVACANIFMAKIEREILRQSCTELLAWKRYQILTTCSPLWSTIVEKIEKFLERKMRIPPNYQMYD